MAYIRGSYSQISPNNIKLSAYPQLVKKNKIMNVTVFGIGYVGLVQAAVFAEAGHHVISVDVDDSKVENLKNIPIYEPGAALWFHDVYTYKPII